MSALSRRAFFRRAAVAAAALAVDPGEFLWKPTTSIFIPPVGGWEPENTPFLVRFMVEMNNEFMRYGEDHPDDVSEKAHEALGELRHWIYQVDPRSTVRLIAAHHPRAGDATRAVEPPLINLHGKLP